MTYRLSKHLKYARYVFRHRWFVFVAACRLGIPLRGLLHDLSKFRWSEWRPYADYFYGERTEAVEAAFDRAWLLHQNRNKHHWQYWLLTKGAGEAQALAMPDKHRREMLADWIGAGRAITDEGDWRPWYERGGMNMTLHPETREWLEAQ